MESNQVIKNAGGITEVGATHSPKETERWGMEFAQRLLPGDVVALAGELGAGKTVLAKGICRGLGFTGEVTSPSFVRVHRYNDNDNDNEKNRVIHHLDFYLVKDANDTADLGLEELFSGEGFVIVEWAQKFPDLLPKGCWWVYLELGERENERWIEVSK